MNRRDFISLHQNGSRLTAELSCEKLFVHWQSVVSSASQGMSEQGTLNDTEWWSGEPPLQTESQRPEQLFSSLRQDLSQYDVVDVTESAWLKDDELRVRLHDLVVMLEINGTEVNFIGEGQLRTNQRSFSNAQSRSTEEA